MSDSPIAYIKADCQEVINRAQTIIGTREIEMLTEINLAYEKFRPRWWNFDRFNYDKNERATKFFNDKGFALNYPSMSEWISKYYQGFNRYEFDYFEGTAKLYYLRRLEKMAQFSMECGEDVMFLSDEGARTLKI